MEELPEVVGGVRVGVAGGRGLDAWVCADEDAYEIWLEDVDEWGEVCVFRGGRVAAGFALL